MYNFDFDEFSEPVDGAEGPENVRVLHFLAPRKPEICIRCRGAIYPAEKGKSAFPR